MLEILTSRPELVPIFLSDHLDGDLVIEKCFHFLEGMGEHFRFGKSDMLEQA